MANNNFHLTQHHCDIIVNIIDLPVVSRFSKTVASSEDVSVCDEGTPTSACLVCLRGSEEQQSSPWEFVDNGFLATNRDGLKCYV